MPSATLPSVAERSSRSWAGWFSAASGISKVGDILRIYAQYWLVYYLANGEPGQKAFWVALAGMVGAIPTLIVSQYAGRLVEHFSARSVAIVSNFILGLISGVIAGLIATGGAEMWTVLCTCFVQGLLIAPLGPATDCIMGELSPISSVREWANKVKDLVFYGVRLPVSVGFFVLALTRSSESGALPWPLLVLMFAIDALTFLATVVVLYYIPSHARVVRKQAPSLGWALHDAYKEPGAIPLAALVLC